MALNAAYSVSILSNSSVQLVYTAL